MWADPAPDGGPPNNWVSFGGPAWTLDAASGQHYLHLFLPEQPDLNWANPAVADAMDDVFRFWLERGATASGPTSSTSSARTRPSQISEQELADLVEDAEHSRTHGLLRDVRHILGGYSRERVVVGDERPAPPPAPRSSYSSSDQLHMVY